jgi:hypothetical protein
LLIAWFRHVADCVMSISRCFCAIFTALIGVRPRLSLCFCWVLTNLSVCLAIQHIPTYFPNQDVIFDQVWMKKWGPPFQEVHHIMKVHEGHSSEVFHDNPGLIRHPLLLWFVGLLTFLLQHVSTSLWGKF